MKKQIIILILILSCGTLYPQEQHHKWQRYSGSWVVENSIATETQAGVMKWNSYLLLDYNSIISLAPFEDYSAIEVKAELKDIYKDNPPEMLISFAVTSEYKSWYYHFYAFRLTGDQEYINKVSLIYSDRLDRKKPLNAKNNTFVKELTSADCSVKYDKMYSYRVAFKGEEVILYINGKKVISAPFPEQSHNGRIALSAKNIKISVDNVEIKKGRETLFLDDFNENSIYIRVLKVRRETGSKNESEKP